MRKVSFKKIQYFFILFAIILSSLIATIFMCNYSLNKLFIQSNLYKNIYELNLKDEYTYAGEIKVIPVENYDLIFLENESQWYRINSNGDYFRIYELEQLNVSYSDFQSITLQGNIKFELNDGTSIYYLSQTNEVKTLGNINETYNAEYLNEYSNIIYASEDSRISISLYSNNENPNFKDIFWSERISQYPLFSDISQIQYFENLSEFYILTKATGISSSKKDGYIFTILNTSYNEIEHQYSFNFENYFIDQQNYEKYFKDFRAINSKYWMNPTGIFTLGNNIMNTNGDKVHWDNWTSDDFSIQEQPFVNYYWNGTSKSFIYKDLSNEYKIFYSDSEFKDQSTTEIANIDSFYQFQNGNYLIDDGVNLFLYQISTQNKYLISEDFEGCDILYGFKKYIFYHETNSSEIKIMNNTFGVTSDLNNINYFLEDGVLFFDDYPTIMIDNSNILNIKINNTYLEPLSLNHWLINESVYDEFGDENKFKLSIETKWNPQGLNINFEIKKNYLPEMNLEQESNNKDISCEVYYSESSKSLIDGFYIQGRASFYWYDFFISEVTFDNNLVYKNEVVFIDQESTIYLVDKFGKSWTYQIYIDSRDKYYWSETQIGIDNYQICLKEGFSENDIWNMNSIESTNITNKNEEVFNLSLIDDKYYDEYNQGLEETIVSWYGSLIPQNRIKWNSNFDKSGNIKSQTLSQVVEEYTIDFINYYYGNGNYYTIPINSTDIEFIYEKPNELLNSNNSQFSIKSVAKKEDTKTINNTNPINSNSKIFFTLNLNYLNSDESNYIMYLQKEIDIWEQQTVEQYGFSYFDNLKFKDVEGTLNQLVINSINTYLVSDDFINANSNIDYSSEIAHVNENDIKISWSPRAKDYLVDINYLDLSIKSQNNSFTTSETSIQNVLNWVFFNNVNKPIHYNSLKVGLIIIFSIILLILIIIFTWIVAYRYKQVKKYKEIEQLKEYYGEKND